MAHRGERSRVERQTACRSRAFFAQHHALRRVEHRLDGIGPAAHGAVVEQRLIAGEREQAQLEGGTHHLVRAVQRVERVERIEQQGQHLAGGQILARDRLGHFGEAGREGELFQIGAQTVKERDGRGLVEIVPAPAAVEHQLGKGKVLAGRGELAGTPPRAARNDGEPSMLRGEDGQDVVGLLCLRCTEHEAAGDKFIGHWAAVHTPPLALPAYKRSDSRFAEKADSSHCPFASPLGVSMRRSAENMAGNFLLVVVAEAPDVVHVISPVCPTRLRRAGALSPV